MLEHLVDSKQSNLEQALFSTRIAHEENVERLKESSWKTDNEIYNLQSAVARLLSTELTYDELIKLPMTIRKDTLLEVILVKIREKSIKFSKVKKGENERKLETVTAMAIWGSSVT